MPARSQMSADAAAALMRCFEAAGMAVWVEGGWGVDALLGEETRTHEDLDVVLEVRHLPGLRALLAERGYAEIPGGTPSNFVLANGAGLEVDVHAVEFDAEGRGAYRMADGNLWHFPAAGFTGRGVIAGVPVRCLTPEVQVICHADGYVPGETDFHDMEQLRARFSVALPPQLRRPSAAEGGGS